MLWDCPQRGTVTFSFTQRPARILEPEVIKSMWLPMTSSYFLIPLFVMPGLYPYILQAMCLILIFSYYFIPPFFLSSSNYPSC